MHKLVALDLDGTLIGGDLTISPRVRTAIARMQQAGVRGCLVTGRMYRAAIPFARELGFDAPLICYQGAAIVDPVTDDVLRHAAVRNPVVRDLIAAAEADGDAPAALSAATSTIANRATGSPTCTHDWRRPSRWSCRRCAKAFAYSDATKAVVIADAADAARYEKRIAERLAGRAYVTRSLPEFVEILDPAVDKGDALTFVAARLGVRKEEILAIGDSWNDAPLLRAAGFGVAMGSAPPELRSAAHAVVADVAHDGVAEAIETYVLGSSA